MEEEKKKTGELAKIEFSQAQVRMIGKAISILALTVLVAFSGFLAYSIVKFVARHSNVLMPPLVAVVLTMMLRPFYEKLQRVFKKNWLAMGALAVIILVPLGLFVVLFGNIVANQILKVIGSIPSIIEWVTEKATTNMPDLIAYIDERNLKPLIQKLDPASWFNISAITATISGSAYSIGSWIFRLFGSMFGWIALPIYTALFLSSRPLNGSDAKKLFVYASPKTRDNIEYLTNQFFDILVVFFRGQVLVAFIQGLLFGIGFHLCGLSYGLLIGLTLGLLNIVPYLGNVIGFIIIIPMALFGTGGGFYLLLKVLAVFAAVQTLDGYLITPKIMGNRTGLNTITIIFSIFFWNSVIGGVIGMLLAIPLSAFVVIFWRLLKKEYFPQETAAAAMIDEKSIERTTK